MAMEMLASKPPLTVDRQYLVSIYEKHSPELYRYAYRMLGDSYLAEDCVSETFSRFIRVNRGSNPAFANIRAYLYRVTHNWITDHYRRQPLPPLELVEDIPAGEDHNPAKMVSRQLEQERVRAALLRLQPDQRLLIELRFLENWSYEAVAEALGKSVEATRTMQHRALSVLKRLLVDLEDEI